MVFVCYFSDPFVGGGWDVLLDKVEGFCGEDVEGGGGDGLFGLFCGGWLMCLAVFLAMLSAASLPIMLLCAGTLMMWMGLWGGMPAMASRMHEVRCL